MHCTNLLKCIVQNTLIKQSLKFRCCTTIHNGLLGYFRQIMFRNGTKLSMETFSTETFKCLVITIGTGTTIHAIAELTIVWLIAMLSCKSFTALARINIIPDNARPMHTLIGDAWVSIVIVILTCLSAKSLHTNTQLGTMYNGYLFISI